MHTSALFGTAVGLRYVRQQIQQQPDDVINYETFGVISGLPVICLFGAGLTRTRVAGLVVGACFGTAYYYGSNFVYSEARRAWLGNQCMCASRARLL